MYVRISVLAAVASGTIAQDYRLPEDPRAVVLSLDYRGGYAPPRANEAPYLEVLADGTLRVPDRAGKADPLTDALTAQELQELLAFVVEERSIVGFDEERVAAKLQASAPDLPRVADAPDTVVKLALPDHRVVAKFNALVIHARAAPQVAELANLAAVARRLELWKRIVEAGGRARCLEQLKGANDYLAQKAPDVGPFAFEHLVGITSSGADGHTWRFERVVGRERLTLVVSVPTPLDVAVVELLREPLAPDDGEQAWRFDEHTRLELTRLAQITSRGEIDAADVYDIRFVAESRRHVEARDRHEQGKLERTFEELGGECAVEFAVDEASAKWAVPVASPLAGELAQFDAHGDATLGRTDQRDPEWVAELAVGPRLAAFIAPDEKNDAWGVPARDFAELLRPSGALPYVLDGELERGAAAIVALAWPLVASELLYPDDGAVLAERARSEAGETRLELLADLEGRADVLERLKAAVEDVGQPDAWNTTRSAELTWTLSGRGEGTWQRDSGNLLAAEFAGELRLELEVVIAASSTAHWHLELEGPVSFAQRALSDD